MDFLLDYLSDISTIIDCYSAYKMYCGDEFDTMHVVCTGLLCVACI